jgi:CRISPR/Cas system CMR subunit Cmr4 (Cas7 group RAMP superfamily)
LQFAVIGAINFYPLSVLDVDRSGTVVAAGQLDLAGVVVVPDHRVCTFVKEVNKRKRRVRRHAESGKTDSGSAAFVWYAQSS